MPRILVRTGWLVSMDPRVGDLRRADILVEDGRIAAIGQGLEATVDETIDGTGMIAMPGLINAHLHTWETGLRSIGSNWGHGDYFKYLHGDMATRYTPEDNYVANLIGALNQIDGGCTSLLDYCHNITSLEQAERSIDALEESGIRAVFALGAGKLPPEREALEPFERRINPRERVEAIRRQRLSSDDALVTMALGVAGPHWAELEPTRQNVALARSLGLRASSHATKRPHLAVVPDGYVRLIEEGVLGEDHCIVHGNYLGGEELKRIVDAGISVTATVQTELRGYAGEPLCRRVRNLGGLPSIGVDVEPRVSGEMFREMQAALLAAQNGAHRENEVRGLPPIQEIPIGSREALAWATIGGAKAMGIEDRTGSLTPGKRADIVLLRAEDLNLFPVWDPLVSIVEQAHAGNVDTVLIDGVVRKRGGHLTFPEAVLRQRKAGLAASAQRLMDEAGYVPRAA
ncbi:hypothetical protein D9599_27240 [Roseomonas sp. KE2513]|uniref:amidohydrolase family protein n=1 Tax=Roseomonas sp. KE2513 TaxID=2479202 RepID=UPI0018DF7C6C|nr:amidohydrolase family protein [Roseomonas sp. KE2513]MBI0539230.1 hypothetical protein [Roseomonas sp. KE2513]